jgi:hypothetical protein
MSEQASAPDPHAKRLEELGAAESTEVKRTRARLKGAARIKAAVSFYNSMGNEETSAIGIRAACLQAMPQAVRTLISIATGKRKGAPAVAILKAIEMVAGGAGHSFEVTPGSSGNTPLAEMTLGELDATLISMSEQVRNLQAIESTAVAVPQSGNATEQTEPALGAQAQE